MENKQIEESISIIQNSKSEIYNYINTHRYQHNLLKESDKWNQICSSLWVIDDTLLSISAYIETEYPQNNGLKYIYTYGILQSLFIQQDAVSNLAEAFSITFDKNNSNLKNIRDKRNAAIGHPTKMRRDQLNNYNYISRISLSKFFFTLETVNKENPSNFQNFEVDNLIYQQLSEVETIIRNISNILVERDKEHRMKFTDRLLDNFNDGLHYQFEKIFSAIFNPRIDNVEFGLTMLKIVKETYQNFKTELEKRNEIQENESIKFELNNYFHAINRLEAYFKNTEENMTNMDARIYAYYIREEHKYFIDIATEIDEEYSKKD